MSDEILHEARKFRVVRIVEKTPDGQERSREVIRHPGAVVVLPIFDDGRVCLIDNARPAIGRRLIELPAGTLDESEDPAAAAKRELAEETGYRAGSIEILADFYSSPGILDERMYLFAATGLAVGPTEFDEGEDIRNLVVAWEEAVAMVRDGRIRDAKTLVGLLWYAAFRR